MPNYDYKCASCGGDFEFFQSMNDDPLTQCPTCNELTLKRKIGTGAGIIFKGSGFYETDYKQSKKEPAKSEPKKESSDSSAKGGSSDSGGCGSASKSE
jgi:putative FmdB family regulatory protein